MKRSLNFTGRQKIQRRKITVLLNRKNGAARSFTATFDLSEFQLPNDARVYFEAYHRTDQRRYSFGTVGAKSTPHDTSLVDLARTENLKFRLLVVDERGTYGLVLAQADRISPIPEGERKPILPVDFSRDLGQQIWKVEYTGDGGAPVLYVTRSLPNIQSFAKSDPLFLFFVYPAVIREVLAHMVFVDGISDVDDPEADWHAEWLQFARMILSGCAPPRVLDPRDEENFDEEEVEKWINSVVEEFCSSRREWPQLISKLEGEERQS